MSIFVSCQCGKKFRARDEHAGKRVKCPNCAAALTIPSPPSAARAIPAQPRPSPPQGLECAVCGATLEATEVTAHGSRVICDACRRTASKSTQVKLVLAVTGSVLLVALAVALWPVLAPKGNHTAEDVSAVAALTEGMRSKPAPPPAQPASTKAGQAPKWGELYVKNESLQAVEFKLRSYVDKSGRTRNPSSGPRWEFEPGEAAYLALDGERVAASKAHYTFTTKNGETKGQQEYGGSGRFTIVIDGKNLRKPIDYAKATIPELKEGARRGDSDAQAHLGRSYLEGRGVPKNLSEAYRLYRASALQGNAKGECGLGFCYEMGYGVQKDGREAVRWYRKAATKGHAVAMANLAGCYSTGVGVRVDWSEAFRWFEKAAAKGDSQGEYGLGYCYHMGYGVQKDGREAIRWYRKAAAQDHVDAMNNLGVCYQYGFFFSVPADLSEALRWYDKAVAKGHREAAKSAQEIRRPTVTTCSWCDGTGVEACPACSGTGGRGVCGLCHGSGTHRCSVCNGRGYN